MARVRAALISSVVVMMAATGATAQTPDSLGWAWVANLGYVQTTGNTSLTTVNAGEKLTFRPNLRWTFTNTGIVVYGKTGGVESANQAFFGVRADFAINPRIAAFGLVNYDRNPFAGINRRFEELVGLSAKLVATPKHVLTVDAGAGNNSQVTGAVTSRFFVARLAPTYRYNITNTAYVEEAVALIENLESTGDLRSSALTSLVAPLSSRISLRVSYLLRYDAEPEFDTPNAVFFKKLDTIFTTGIQLTL